jgi:hypothetical protein
MESHVERVKAVTNKEEVWAGKQREEKHLEDHENNIKMYLKNRAEGAE